MFSLIHKVLHAARSFDAACKKINKLENHTQVLEEKLKRFERLADENESLWEFLDQQKEIDEVFINSEYDGELAHILLCGIKVPGDA